MLPYLGALVLIVNFFSYIGGFLLVDVRSPRVGHDASNVFKSQREDFRRHPRRNSAGGGLELRDDDELLEVTTFPDDLKDELEEYDDDDIAWSTTPGFGARTATAGGSTGGPSTGVIQKGETCVTTTTSGRDPSDGRWFNYSSSNLRFYAYTAIYDDRPSLAPDQPVVRVIGVMRNLEDWTTQGRTPPTIYCILHHADRQTVVRMDDAPKPIGYGWPVNGEWLREYVFACPLKGKKVPTAVSVLTAAADRHATRSCMPVERPVKTDVVKDFGICVQVAFDRLDIYRLIEWMELQRLLGVSEVFVYDLSLDAASLKVLREYVNEGFVKLRKTDYIPHGPQQVCLYFALSSSPCSNPISTSICLSFVHHFVRLHPSVHPPVRLRPSPSVFVRLRPSPFVSVRLRPSPSV